MPAKESRELPLLIALYLLVAGLYLLLLPWTESWLTHPVARRFPDILTSFPVRGFISGLGLTHLFYLLRRRA